MGQQARLLQYILGSALLFTALRAQTILQSVPFDPFRLECNVQRAVSEMTMRLVESQGEDFLIFMLFKVSTKYLVNDRCATRGHDVHNTVRRHQQEVPARSQILRLPGLTDLEFPP